MRILLTGSEGFIGSHIRFMLRLNGHNVIGCDRRSDITPDDVVNLNFSKKRKDFDLAIHCAANLFDNFHENLEATQNLVEQTMSRWPIIFTSSAAVYGGRQVAKETSKLEPINDYGYFKMKEEQCLYPQDYILRLGNVYGVDSDHGVISKWVGDEEPMFINNRGQSIRDFVFVDDVVRAVYQIVTDKIKPGVYNLGSGKGTSIIDLYHRMHPTSEWETPHFVDNVNEIRESILDMNKFEKEFGWKPRQLE